MSILVKKNAVSKITFSNDTETFEKKKFEKTQTKTDKNFISIPQMNKKKFSWPRKTVSEKIVKQRMEKTGEKVLKKHSIKSFLNN